MDLEYPAMLYKAGGSMLEWDGEMFDHLLVNDADEAKAALSDGWSVGKPQAKKEAPKDDEPEMSEPEAAPEVAPKAKKVRRARKAKKA